MGPKTQKSKLSEMVGGRLGQVRNVPTDLFRSLRTQIGRYLVGISDAEFGENALICCNERKVQCSKSGFVKFLFSYINIQKSVIILSYTFVSIRRDEKLKWITNDFQLRPLKCIFAQSRSIFGFHAHWPNFADFGITDAEQISLDLGPEAS